MPARTPLTLPKFWASLDTLGAALKKGQKHPLVGITQGGSSRKGSGARVAATDADTQNKRKKTR